jgi:hypothetical protein
MRVVLLTIAIFGASFVGTAYSWGDITGGDEVEEWVDITVTNWNALMVASLVTIGGCSGYLTYKALKAHRRTPSSKDD